MFHLHLKKKKKKLSEEEDDNSNAFNDLVTSLLLLGQLLCVVTIHLVMRITVKLTLLGACALSYDPSFHMSLYSMLVAHRNWCHSARFLLIGLDN